MCSELLCVGELYDLEQRIFYNRIGEPCRDIGDRCALFLRLLDVGVHKHGTAGTEIDRRVGKQRFFGKLFRRKPKRGGKVFDKRAAAGGAGFVEDDGIHRAILQPDAFHILPADVQHAVYQRIEECGGSGVRDGLHLAVVEAQGGFHQRFSVPGRAGTGDMRPLRHGGQDLQNGLPRDLDRVSAI